MKSTHSYRLLILLYLYVLSLLAMEQPIQPTFSSSIHTIPHNIIKKMIGLSWTKDCPVGINQLRYVSLLHWGYDEQVYVGHLIVHQAIACEIVEIFAELFAHKFPIQHMRLIDEYDADDEKSMQANNTSAFCFRKNTTNPAIISNHGYGIAIDINPLINPYIRDDIVLPKRGRPYLDRTIRHKGIITDAPDNICYQVFTKRGYHWGGNTWPDRKDYQHFSKNVTQVIGH